MSIVKKIKKSDIEEGTARLFQCGESKIVVCNAGGNFYAVEDVCSHDDGELVSEKSDLIETCELQCPRHGARFDVRTGQATRMPAIAPIKTFKVLTGGDELEVIIED